MIIRQHISGKRLIVFDKRNPAAKPYIEELYDSGADWVIISHIPESVITESWDSTFGYPRDHDTLWRQDFPYVAFTIDTKEILSDLISEVEK